MQLSITIDIHCDTIAYVQKLNNETCVVYLRPSITTTYQD